MKTGRLCYIYGEWKCIILEVTRYGVWVLPLEGYAQRQAGEVFHYQHRAIECYW